MRLAICYQWVEPARGGAETYVSDLCRRLLAAGHQVDLVAERLAPEAHTPGLHHVPISTRGATSLGRIWKFARCCEKRLAERAGEYDCSIGFINTWGQDILIPQGGVRDASLAANALRFGSPVGRAAYKFAKKANPKWQVYAAIERRQYDSARGSTIVAVSHMVEEHLMRYQHVAPERIRVIPNAIDVDRLRVDNAHAVRAAFRAAHGIGPTENVALFTGHNFRLKGLGPLLKAMADRLKRSDAIPLRLLVCGGGDPAPFRTLAQRLGIEQHVTFLGRVPDVRACFHASDLFVLPTYYDPCSLVVFEALACGLPVVTTRCNGAGELLSQGVEGFVIDSPDDQPGLIAALDALSNAQFRGRAAVAAARLGREQSFDRHVDRLLEVAAQSAAQKRSFKRRRHASAARNTSFASTHTES